MLFLPVVVHFQIDKKHSSSCSLKTTMPGIISSWLKTKIWGQGLQNFVRGNHTLLSEKGNYCPANLITNQFYFHYQALLTS